MPRTLTLKIHPHKDGGIAMTVVHTLKFGDEDAAETHSTSATDAWGSDASLKDGARLAIDAYLLRLKEDDKANVSPIEKAARG